MSNSMKSPGKAGDYWAPGKVRKDLFQTISRGQSLLAISAGRMKFEPVLKIAYAALVFSGPVNFGFPKLFHQ